MEGHTEGTHEGTHGGTHRGDTRPRSGSWNSEAPGKGQTRGRVMRSPPGPQRPRRKGVGPQSRRLSVLRSSARPPRPLGVPPRADSPVTEPLSG